MVILVFTAGYLRVTHPFAMAPRKVPFDLHVLGMPPALILSQDQTLQKNLFLFVFNLFCSFFVKRIVLILRYVIVRHI